MGTTASASRLLISKMFQPTRYPGWEVGTQVA